MTENKRLEKFAKLVSDKPSNFLAKLAHYRANKKWLDNSSKIAISVLEALKEKGLSQKDLAEKMNVSAQQISKIVKGQQNLTFETVGKLEDALGISLMEIIVFKPVNEIKTNALVIQAKQESLSSEMLLKEMVNNAFSEKFKKKETAKMSVVYSKGKNFLDCQNPVSFNEVVYNKVM